MDDITILNSVDGKDEITNKKITLNEDEDSKTITVKVTGKGNYEGDETIGTYLVSRLNGDMVDLGKVKVVAREKSSGKDIGIGKQTYTGSPIEPAIRVLAKQGSAWVELDPETYRVSCMGNVNIGKGRVLVNSVPGKSAGNKTARFSITKKDVKTFG